MTQQSKILIPLAIIGLFFFSIGFALGINSYLMPVLKDSLQISGATATLLLAATFVPFLLFGIPATVMYPGHRLQAYHGIVISYFRPCLLFVHPCCQPRLANMVSHSQFRKRRSQYYTPGFCQSLRYHPRPNGLCRQAYVLHGYMQQVGLAGNHIVYHPGHWQRH